MGGDHNDFLMLFFLVLGFWLLLRANAMRVGKRARPAPQHQTGVLAGLRRAWAWLDGMPRPLVAGEPAAWMEVGAGIALVAAVAIKASSAVLIPIVLAGTARRMRLALGLLIGFAGAGAMTIAAFGLNLPNIGQQARFVIPAGIPNLTGLALGFGGETAEMRYVLSLLLFAVILGWSIWTWRTRRWLHGVRLGQPGARRHAELDAPVVHRLAVAVRRPLALARLRIAAVVLGVYIYLAWMPYSSEILGFLHVNPATTTLGQQEASYMTSVLF